MKTGDKKLIIDGLNIGLLCEVIEVKSGGSILVLVDGTETHEPDYALKEPNLEHAITAISRLRDFNDAERKKLEIKEKDIAVLKNRVQKLWTLLID